MRRQHYTFPAQGDQRRIVTRPVPPRTVAPTGRRPRHRGHRAVAPDHGAIRVRPDGHIAWAVIVDEPADAIESALRAASRSWFGVPEATVIPVGDRHA
ncbi:aromatic-ring hydroxylase C-terminal domain-containing protein [Nocardia aurantiaca]|uniref:Uncharacterized protein n=1 Tax=Nocardia aurantiaca TaxID=2675850 RepID=A0A6I3L9A2_9NOCA|nr:hypothetical protein [Nocardia aurantiaca]MTE16439.1 hypothetical protein [Nocardia aurantiaca]